MKILTINGSPRGEQGNTEVLIKAFLDGAREVGAETETVYLKDKQIANCRGCFGCWSTTPGVCVHKDDMPELLEKVLQSDIAILASPLYIYTVTGLMKTFMDRLLPMAQPYIEVEDGLCNHPPRYPNAASRSIVLISNSGFPSQEHFSGLKETFKCWIRNGNRGLAGMICCAGGALLQVPELSGYFNWYLDAVRQAGREVVQNGVIADETQSALDRPLVGDIKLYAEQVNAFWERMGIPRI